jgi:hypothetical protein
MKRRSKAGGEPAKPRHARLRRADAAIHRSLRAVVPVRAAARKDETWEQLAATSAVLKIIGESQGRLEPAFQAILERAARLKVDKFYPKSVDR